MMIWVRSLLCSEISTGPKAESLLRPVGPLSEIEPGTNGRTILHNPCSDHLISRILRRHKLVDQAQFGAGKQCFGGVEFGTEVADRKVGGRIGERVEADGEGVGFGVGQDIGLGGVDGVIVESSPNRTLTGVA
jgi:hypothetical protein